MYCYGYAPYTRKIITSEQNMAAAASESNASRYPSEKSVKEALDMLKPPGILSKVGPRKFHLQIMFTYLRMKQESEFIGLN